MAIPKIITHSMGYPIDTEFMLRATKESESIEVFHTLRSACKSALTNHTPCHVNDFPTIIHNILNSYWASPFWSLSDKPKVIKRCIELVKEHHRVSNYRC